MNLSAIKTACFGGKRATIYNAVRGIGRGQWISNGYGAYLVEGIEIGSEAALMELWNLSDKARAKAVIMMSPVSDRRFTIDYWPGEEELQERGAVAIGDKPYTALYSSHGMLWIDNDLLKPLRRDYLHFGARWEYGRPLIAAYEDMAEAKALILPVANGLARELRDAANWMRAAPFTWPDAEEEAAEAEKAAEAIAAAAAGTSSDPPDGGPPSPKGKACDDEPGGD